MHVTEGTAHNEFIEMEIYPARPPWRHPLPLGDGSMGDGSITVHVQSPDGSSGPETQQSIMWWPPEPNTLLEMAEISRQRFNGQYEQGKSPDRENERTDRTLNNLLADAEVVSILLAEAL